MRRRCEEGFGGDACLLQELNSTKPTEGHVLTYVVLEMALPQAFESAYESQEARILFQKCRCVGVA